ncbi:hypothetical protein HGRIS_005503 [Hohenbuehelia grisea]
MDWLRTSLRNLRIRLERCFLRLVHKRVEHMAEVAWQEMAHSACPVFSMESFLFSFEVVWSESGDSVASLKLAPQRHLCKPTPTTRVELSIPVTKWIGSSEAFGVKTPANEVATTLDGASHGITPKAPMPSASASPSEVPTFATPVGTFQTTPASSSHSSEDSYHTCASRSSEGTGSHSSETHPSTVHLPVILENTVDSSQTNETSLETLQSHSFLQATLGTRVSTDSANSLLYRSFITSSDASEGMSINMIGFATPTLSSLNLSLSTFSSSSYTSSTQSGSDNPSATPSPTVPMHARLDDLGADAGPAIIQAPSSQSSIHYHTHHHHHRHDHQHFHYGDNYTTRSVQGNVGGHNNSYMYASGST